MQKMSRIATLLALTIALLLSGCGNGPVTNTNNAGGTPKPGDAPKSSGGKKTIAVIPKSTSHEFWQQVKLGAESAVKDKNYEIIFKAGEPGDDANAQLTLCERMLAQGADAIVLAPVHSQFLVQAVEKAFEKKVPMVIIDSGIDADFSKYAAFVATHNTEGGAMAARRLAKALNGKGQVLLLRYEKGSASTTEREDGFTQTLAKEFPGIKILAEKYAGPTRDTALKNANELLAANPGFDGVFACNESSAMGMLLALREKQLAGKVKFVGFDTAKDLIEAVDKGEIEALVAQNPFMIGAEGVAQAIAALEGRKPESIVIPAIVKDKEYFKKEAEEEKAKGHAFNQAEEEKKNAADIARMEAEFIKQQAAARATLAEEEEKQKLLNKEEEAFKQREAELGKIKADLDRQAEEQKKKIEAELARQAEALKAAGDAEKAREAALLAEVVQQSEEQKKKVEAALARERALQAEVEGQDAKRQAEFKRIQEQDAKAAAELQAKLAAEHQAVLDKQRKQEEEDRKLAEEVKRLKEENERRVAEQAKLLDDRARAEKK